MFYVYFLHSEIQINKSYIGFTKNLKQRLDDHNSGKSIFTSKYKPWKLIAFFSFNEEIKARRFERYLKSNAGKIFLKRYC
jgi:putative endonuclease